MSQINLVPNRSSRSLTVVFEGLDELIGQYIPNTNRSVVPSTSHPRAEVQTTRNTGNITIGLKKHIEMASKPTGVDGVCYGARGHIGSGEDGKVREQGRVTAASGSVLMQKAGLLLKAHIIGFS